MYPTLVTADGLARSAEREIAAHEPTRLSIPAPGSSDHSRGPRFHRESPEGSLAALTQSRPLFAPPALRSHHRDSSSPLSADVLEGSGTPSSSHHGRGARRGRVEGSPSRVASVPSESSLDALMRRSFTRHGSTSSTRMGRPSLELHYRLDAHDEPQAQLSDLSAARSHLRGQIEEARSELSEARSLLTRSQASDLSRPARQECVAQALAHFHSALAMRHSVLAGAEDLSAEDQRRVRQFAEHPGWSNIGRPVLRAAQQEGLPLGL